MDFTIRALVPSEIPSLLEMIRELARFEKCERLVEANEQTLNESFFGAEPSARALFARDGEKPAGYAIYFWTFSSFAGRRGIWLDDLYVRPEFRRGGLGKALITTVAQAGVERGCARFEWTALDWNDRALNFYRSLGAQTLDEWKLLRLEETGLKTLGTPKPGLPGTVL
jgi:GNAT superfamily N-acetyltransferase